MKALRWGLAGGMALLSLAGVAAADRAAVRVEGLQCEYLSDPLGLDTLHPRLSWRLSSNRRGVKQSAYEVLVASSERELDLDRGDLWDSGMTASDQSFQVPYAGKALASREHCWWKVRVWDADGAASAWSRPAEWEMGLLSERDWAGKWIGRTADTAYHPAPLLRREFAVRGKVKRARLYVCGLGYHEVHLNGEKVGDHVLDPGYTRFDRRDLYVVHDVTRQLHSGANALGVMLGTGWYNVHTIAVWYFDKAPWRGAPKVRLDLKIDYADGRTETVSTDQNWKTAEGPVVFDSIYAGESYDARREKPGWDAVGYDDRSWDAAKLVDAPGGALTAQAMPPIRITETRKPVKVTEPKPGVFLFDMGQNLAGHAQLTASGLPGTKITMRYGERLNPDGTLRQADIAEHMHPFNMGWPPGTPAPRFQTDTYTLKGSGTETWEARFTYHGFQYVEVTGFPGKPTLDSLRARVTHSDVQSAGEFECSNPLLNRIQQATRWSYVNNLASIPTDCPHREKNGWTGDAHLAAEAGLYNFQPAAVYTKWIRDLADEMRPTGELPGIVPSSGWGYAWGNGPAWDSAYVLIPWYLYQYCGDSRILETNYDQMRRYVDYLTRKSRGGISNLGLGDWVAPSKMAPVEVTSTGYYYEDARVVARAAELLGKSEDARKYNALADGIREAFNARFFHPDTASYAEGSQTSLATALNWGLVPDEYRARVVANLVAAVDAKGGHLDCGILGTKYLLNVLLDNGRADVAYRVASQTTRPSWGAWIKEGATTLWEGWDAAGSLNHIMFGDVSAWFYRALAGIRPDAPGFHRIRIRPQVVGDLTWARGSYNSISGRIESAWKRSADHLDLDVTIPANTVAMVYVPASAPDGVTEGGKPAAKASGIHFLRMEGGAAVYEVGSGSYHFRSPWKGA